MTITRDDHRRAHIQGKAFLLCAMAGATRTGTLPPDLVESYAEGIAVGLREFVASYVSDRAAYELLQRAADHISGRLGGEHAAPAKGQDT